MPPPALLALVAVIALLALIPTRRLFLAGWSTRRLALYFLALVGLGVLVAELRAPARFLIPILVVVYVAPFVTAREGFARLFRRPGGSTPIVHGPGTRSLPGPPEIVEPDEGAGGGARSVADSTAGEDAGDREDEPVAEDAGNGARTSDDPTAGG